MSHWVWFVVLVVSWVLGITALLRFLNWAAKRREDGDALAVFEQMTGPYRDDDDDE